MKIKQLFGIIVFVIVGAMFVAACGPTAPEAPAAQAGDTEHEEAEHNDEHGQMDDEHGHMDMHDPEQHMAGAHNVPEEAAAVPNPIAANEDSLAAGGQLFATNCAVCHGEKGLGDGPGAAGLENPPADLTAGHVQGLTDGALFYIISHGRPDTPMPAWDNVLDEEQRWHVVNYIRTFGQ